MKYLVNYISYGKTKNKIVEALSGKEAADIIKADHPNCEVLRITGNTEHIRHFEAMKKMKGLR